MQVFRRFLKNAEKPLSREAVRLIVQDRKGGGHASIRLEQDFLSRYFKPEQKRNEIESIIASVSYLK